MQVISGKLTEGGFDENIDNTANEFSIFSHSTEKSGHHVDYLPDTADKSEIESLEASFLNDFTKWIKDQTLSISMSEDGATVDDDIEAVIQAAAKKVGGEDLSMAQADEHLFNHLGSADTLTVQEEKIHPYSTRGVVAGFDTLGSLTVDDEANTSAPVRNESDNVNILFLMEVVISVGRSETLEIMKNADPSSTAAEFGRKHGLDADVVNTLKQHITEHLEAFHPTKPAQVHDIDGLKHESSNAGFLCDYGDSSIDVPSSNIEYPKEAVVIGKDITESNQLDDKAQELYREVQYNMLMEKFGHYTQYSGKVNPDCPSKSKQGQDSGADSNVFGKVQSTRGTEPVLQSFPLQFTNHANYMDKFMNRNKRDTVYNRLYALAEKKQKWIVRAQKCKHDKQEQEYQQSRQAQLVSVRSKQLMSDQSSQGDFVHVGERLYREGFADLAKRDKQHAARNKEGRVDKTWSCPKCAYVNQYNDASCRNRVATLHKNNPCYKKSDNTKTPLNTNARAYSQTPMTVSAELYCGQQKPNRAFRPTLLAASSKAGKKLLDQSKENLTKLSQDRWKRDQMMMEDLYNKTCTFRPQINLVSKAIVRNREELTTAGIEGKRKGKHQTLYEQAFEKQALQLEREERYLKSIPFKPNIGINHHYVSGDRNNNDLVERLAISQVEAIEQNRIKLMEKYASDRDPETGKRYFIPETGRGPITARNQMKLPIGEYLHSTAKDRLKQQEEMVEAEMKDIKQKSEQRFTSDYSQQLLHIRKRRAYQEIFDILIAAQRCSVREDRSVYVQDHEELGGEDSASETKIEDASYIVDMVQPNLVNIESLPENIAKFVLALFSCNHYQPITQDKICILMDRLLSDDSGCTNTDFLLVLEDAINRGNISRHLQERQQEIDKDITFRPAINAHSARMALRNGRAGKEQVYETLNQFYDHYTRRKEEARKDDEREFAKQHPFQPVFLTKGKQISDYYKRFRETEEDKDKKSSIPLPTAIPHPHPFVRPIGCEDIICATASRAK